MVWERWKNMAVNIQPQKDKMCKHMDRCDKFLNLLSKSEIQMHLFTSNALFGHWCIPYF